jgi:hypothetical protein
LSSDTFRSSSLKKVAIIITTPPRKAERMHPNGGTSEFNQDTILAQRIPVTQATQKVGVGLFFLVLSYITKCATSEPKRAAARHGNKDTIHVPSPAARIPPTITTALLTLFMANLL